MTNSAMTTETYTTIIAESREAGLWDVAADRPLMETMPAGFSCIGRDANGLATYVKPCGEVLKVERIDG